MVIKNFGKIRAQDLIGKPFDSTWEIILPSSDNAEHSNDQDPKDTKTSKEPMLLRLPHMDLDESEWLESGTSTSFCDNRLIHDDGTAQRLSQHEVEAMKSQVNDGQLQSTVMLQKLIDNSASFDKRTQYSKAKYIQRKREKFAKIFTVIRPTPRVICDHYLNKGNFRIRYVVANSF